VCIFVSLQTAVPHALVCAVDAAWFVFLYIVGGWVLVVWLCVLSNRARALTRAREEQEQQRRQEQDHDAIGPKARALQLVPMEREVEPSAPLLEEERQSVI
jgi:hypothetical protein